MFCAQCGAPLDSDANFCPRCGTPVKGDPPAATEPPQQADPAPAAAAVAATPPDRTSVEGSGVHGWLHRRKEEHERRKQEDADYSTALAKLHGGDDSPETLAELQRLADPRHRKDSHAALIGYSNVLLADDLLTPDEEARWARVSDALGIHRADLGSEEFAGIMSRLAIGRINDGRLPEMPPGTARLMAKPGETIHLEAPAALMKEVIDREFRGGSRGVSIPIAKGVRYRTSSFRGRSVAVGSHLEAADTGVLSVSSRRVVFLGDRKTIDTPYAKLAGIDAYTDGLRVHSSSRQTAPLFKISSGAEVVAATLQAAARASAT